MIKFHKIALLLICLSGLQAQNVTQMEKQAQSLERQIKDEQQELDSLNVLLENQVARIDSIKGVSDSDKGKIRKLMSASLPISEQINKKQARIATLRKDLGKIQFQLAQRYSSIIDSLQQVEKSGSGKIKQADLNQEIIFYTEKYLQYSPAFKALSFEPNKIQQISLSATADSLERAIAREYLQNALADINDHLTHISKNREELQDIVRLESETEDFVQEVEGTYFGVLSQSDNFATESERNFQGPTGQSTQAADAASNSPTHVETSGRLLYQLKIDGVSNFSVTKEFNSDLPQIRLSLAEYLDLLKEAEKRLSDFQTLIRQKLEKNR